MNEPGAKAGLGLDLYGPLGNYTIYLPSCEKQEEERDEDKV